MLTRIRSKISAALETVYMRAFPSTKIRSRIGRCSTSKTFEKTVDQLLEDHFAEFSSMEHPNRESISVALRALEGRPAAILETGSSAWGINSSRLFDQYVRNFGGNFCTVDIRPAPARRLSPVVSNKTEMLTGDSVKAMRELSERTPTPIYDLVYLDSFDLDIEQPLPSMMHGLAEFMLLDRITKPGSLVLVDDTPKNEMEWLRVTGQKREAISISTPVGRIVPGKGALIAAFLDTTQFEILRHDYQILLRRR